MVSPSNSTVDGRAGLVPTPMTNLSPPIRVLVPWSFVTVMVWSSMNFAVPTSIATWLRAS